MMSTKTYVNIFKKDFLFCNILCREGNFLGYAQLLQVININNVDRFFYLSQLLLRFKFFYIAISNIYIVDKSLLYYVYIN